MAATMAPVLLVAVPPASAASHRVVLGGVPVEVPAGTTEVVTVNHEGGYHAQAEFWHLVSGRWRARLRARDARIGYGGLVGWHVRKQGTGTTPIGTMRLLFGFGTHADRAGWEMPYRRIVAGDFWVEDNASRYYNRYRNASEGGFRADLPVSDENGSERLSSYPRQYEFAFATSYNYTHPVRHRGAGIFLHVNGSGATAGCVSVPRWFMKDLMTRLRPGDRPVLAVGR